MRDAAIQLVLAPLLVGLAGLAARRWDARLGGLVSSFPAVVGPVLLVSALDRGPRFAAEAAVGVLVGLVALAGFVAVYGRVAVRHGWPLSLAAGWLAAIALGAAATRAHVGPVGALLLACAALGCGHVALPTVHESGGTRAPRENLAWRMLATAILVVVLSQAVLALGATVGGALAALPVLACVLAVFTHRGAGVGALVDLLRGMLLGMAAFVAFCLLVAVLLTRTDVVAAFVLATAAACLVQGVMVWWQPRTG